MNSLVQSAGPPSRRQAEVDAASQDIIGMRAEFQKMLGDAIGIERFERAVLTAIQRDPDLLSLPRESLASAGLRAAQDRLLPDGREGVFLVRWNSNTRRKEVTWQPMVYGIIKIAKQYAGVRSLSCEVVYDGEPHRILLGDEMRISHERLPNKVKDGAEIGCYAIVTFADGEREREFMTAQQIAQVEASSVSAEKGKGPWKTWRGEMVRKTVIRRLLKKIPARDEGSERLHQVVGRVDEDYNFGRQASEVISQEGADADQPAPEALPELASEPERLPLLTADFSEVRWISEKEWPEQAVKTINAIADLKLEQWVEQMKSDLVKIDESYPQHADRVVEALQARRSRGGPPAKPARSNAREDARVT